MKFIIMQFSPRSISSLLGPNILLKSCRLDSSGSGQVPVEGANEHDTEPSVSIEGGEFLD
jgi:hypothetical protein